MKLFIFIVFPVALAMSYTFPMTPLSENSLLNFQEDNVFKERDFDEELQQLKLIKFRAILMTAKLFDTLNDTTTSYTVFALSDKAIASAPPGLLDNATRLPEVLKYHVHLGAFRTNMIARNMRLKTLLGGEQKIRFEIYSGLIYGSCQQIGSPKDDTYDNGILDVMNGVMVPPEGDFVDIIFNNKSFGSLQSYISIANLKPFLKKQDPMTLLAPNDAAFKKLSPDVIDKLKSDKAFLHSVLEYHVLTAIYCSVGFVNGNEVETYQGGNVKVTKSGGKVHINNSTIIQADIIAYNGVIHFIDSVLLPPPSSFS